jgi:hypothetical protein
MIIPSCVLRLEVGLALVNIHLANRVLGHKHPPVGNFCVLDAARRGDVLGRFFPKNLDCGSLLSFLVYTSSQRFLQQRAMFERYTEKARRVIFFARYEASQVGSPIIETEHLLWGLLREDKGLAQRFLGSAWAAEEVWKRIQQSKPANKKIPGPVDLPISNECKRVLTFAADEAEQLSSKHIGSEHLLLGLLREEKCLAARILHEQGILLNSVRQDLIRVPHKPSATEEFVREPRHLPADVAEAQDRLKTIVKRMEEAVANHDFATARACSDEERKERDKLLLLYQQHGLNDWLFD